MNKTVVMPIKNSEQSELEISRFLTKMKIKPINVIRIKENDEGTEATITYKDVAAVKYVATGIAG